MTVPKHNQRYLYGVDATLRHQPGTSEFYQGLVIGTEWLWNNQKFQDVELGIDPGTGDPIFGDQHAHRNGGYAYLEAFLGRRYSVGVRGDYAEDPFGAANRQRTYSAFATWMPSEFQRLRFQFDQDRRQRRTKQPALHSSVDRIPGESLTWLRDALNSHRPCSAPVCSRSRRAPPERHCAWSPPRPTSPT